jgi:hypothetical protein
MELEDLVHRCLNHTLGLKTMAAGVCGGEAVNVRATRKQKKDRTEAKSLKSRDPVSPAGPTFLGFHNLPK